MVMKRESSFAARVAIVAALGDLVAESAARRLRHEARLWQGWSYTPRLVVVKDSGRPRRRQGGGTGAAYLSRMNPRGGPAAGDDEEAAARPPPGFSDAPRHAEASVTSGAVLATPVVIVV
jgi:hypothetical protein